MGATLALSQHERLLTATTPLGGDVLVPVRLAGTEELSRPFLFTVDFSSERANVAASALLGEPVGLTLALGRGQERHFHGRVRSFANLGPEGTTGRTRYRAELVPWLWMLSLSSDTRTFEEQSPVEIVEAVFKAAGYADHKRALVSPPDPLRYVVQYAESDLAFVSRLLEEAGLYYRFEFAADKHTLVISDAEARPVPDVGSAPVPVMPPHTGPGRGGADRGVVTAVERVRAMHAGRVSLMRHQVGGQADEAAVSSRGGHAAATRHAYLGTEFTPLAHGLRAEPEARLRVEAEEAAADVVRGTSTCGWFTAGARVGISGASEALDSEVCLTRVSHDVANGGFVAAGGEARGGEARGGDPDDGAHVENTFAAIPAAVRFRPPRETPRPVVRGTFTALVIGAGGGGTIDADGDGSVRLAFPWDRGVGGRSQHRVPVAAAWAGTGWGAVQLPRVGQHVLVEFLEGDPSRPIVTGRVYAPGAHPYALPADKTQSGVKSRSLGGGSDNYNELRFEDKQGSEHVYVQAERDLQVKVKHDETRDVLHDRTTTVKNHDTRTVTDGHDKVVVTKGNRTLEVAQGDHVVTVTRGKQTVTVHGDHSLTVTNGTRSATIELGDDELTVRNGHLKIDVTQGNVVIKAPAGAVTIEAPAQGITLKSGASSVAVKPDGITIGGPQVVVEGRAQATLKAPVVSVQGQAQAELSGAMVSVQGKAVAKVEGAVTQVTGTGMLKLGGGVTMVG